MKFSFTKGFFSRLVGYLNPPPRVGGLEITDSALRYLLLSSDGAEIVKQISERLPSGVIEHGQVKSKAKLKEVLGKFRSQLGYRWRPTNVVVSISAANVYTQLFNSPLVPTAKLDEAARLNLQVISPVDVRSAYYDWQLVGEEAASDKLELIGAFVSSSLIDDLTDCLTAANFAVMAIEPVPFSLARAVKSFVGADSQPRLVFNLAGDGLDFFILKGGSLYFSYFVSWNEAGGNNSSEISLAAIKKLVATELKRIIGFYSNRWGGAIGELILLSPKANKEIAAAIKGDFNLEVYELPLAQQPPLSMSWLGAWGAAWRGLVPRAKDKLISLAKVGTERQFEQSRVIWFISFWRNVVIGSLIGILLVFGIFDLIVRYSLANVSSQSVGLPEELAGEEVKQLQAAARKFNLLVEKALAAQKQSHPWSPLLGQLRSLSAGRVEINRIGIDQESLLVTIGGQAGSERTVIDFKNVLANEPNFKEISLPLTSIKLDPSGKAVFNLSFKLKKLP